jgi:GWxTD domain-containing protein
MKTYILSVLFLVLLISPSSAQKKTHSSYNDSASSFFNFDALNFYTTEGTKSRLDIYIEVPLSKLEFKKSQNAGAQYASDFDLTIEAIDNSGKSVYYNVSKEEITSKETGTEYLSNNSQVITKNVFLTPGQYTIHVKLYEYSTKNSVEKKKDIVVKDFLSKPLTISDVMIVSGMTEENGKKFITPDVTRNIGLLDTFHLFFYAYDNSPVPDNESGEAPLGVTCRIYDFNKKEVYSYNKNIDRSKASGNQNQVIFTIPSQGFLLGNYTLEINAAAGTETASTSASFKNVSTDFPLDLNNVDELIDQLQYIAQDKEMDYMRGGNSLQEKQRRFLEFWKSKDPTPLTKKNEVMIAYYRRLNYADQHFSTVYTKGWKTDMGMVFIIFGMPSNIDRHPYEMDTKPYEIWDYYDISRQFIFVDFTGFGDYRLTTPIWDKFRR